MSEKVIASESVDQIGLVLDAAKELKSDVESALKADETLDLVNLVVLLERLHRLAERVDMIIVYTLYADKKDSLSTEERARMLAAVKIRNPHSYEEWKQFFEDNKK